MPLHSYKTWVGIAADRINGTLTTATAQGATSLPLSNQVGMLNTTVASNGVNGAGSAVAASSVTALLATSVPTGTPTSGTLVIASSSSTTAVFTYTLSGSTFTVTYVSGAGGGTDTVSVGAVFGIVVGTQTTSLATSGASYSAIIIDGALTETVACSGNLSSNAIACAATANAHSANVYVVFQVTASIGPTAYLPLDKFDPVDEYAQLLQQTYSGSAVKTIAAIQGLRTSTWDISGPVFVDTIGYLLGGFFGAEDYAAGPPKTHTFSTQNSNTTLQPVAYIFYNYDGYNQRIFAGGKITDLTLTFDPKALVKHDTKFMARASGVVTTSTYSGSAVLPVASWNGYLTVGGTALQKTKTFDVTFSREESEQIPVLQGIQDPYTVWAGVVTAKGKVTFVMEDDSQMLDYINETQPAVLLTCSQGTGTTLTEVNIQMTECNYTTAKVIQQGATYVTNEIEYEGIGNSTDANTSGGGLSPARVVVKNAIGQYVYC